MKLLLSALLTAAVSLSASATNVSGVIMGTTTWTKANSPYIVTAHTLVDDGATLYIEPGVEVRVDPNVDFFVDGSLHAIGTATDPIIFKANSTNPNRKSWRGVNVRSDGAVDSAVFNYCHFTSGETPVYALSGDIVLIDHCLFTECTKAVLLTCYHACHVSNTVIKHCDLGIHASGGVSNVVNNEVANVNTIGLDVYNGYVAENFVHDAQTGIAFQGTPGNYSELSNNKVVNCGHGIAAKGVSSHGVHHNLSVYNDIGYVVSDYGGNVNNNTALHNKTGVAITSIIAVFKNNCIDSCTDYLAKTAGWVQEIDLSGNYWGTTDSATLYSKSYEFYDDFNAPKAILLPALQQGDGSCKSYTGPIVTNIPETQKAIQPVAFPNPFTASFSIDLQGKATTLEIFNMTGQKLLSLDAKGRNKMEVDMSAYPAGLYHFRVNFIDNTIYTGKLVKQ